MPRSSWRKGRRLKPWSMVLAIAVSSLWLARDAAPDFVAPPRTWLHADREQHAQTLLASQPPRDVTGSFSPLLRRAGAEGAQSEVVEDRSQLVQAWGVFGVVAYLSYGVAKVVPIVLDGLGAIEEVWQWALLAVTLLFFAYVEGYRGFQLGFSPRVVSRAWVVSEETSEAPVWHKVLAPAFCIGYFHGTKRRVITSWAVTTVIFAVVIGVKQLDNPYRAIIDAGVIVGLMWGILSIIVLYIASLQSQKPPEYDPALPEDTPYTPPPNIS